MSGTAGDEKGFSLFAHPSSAILSIFIRLRLRRFPFVRTGRPNKSVSKSKIDFFQKVLLKNHLLHAYCLGFD